MMSSETVSRIGGNRKPQTFRDCKQCGKNFGPLERLAIQFCSKACGYEYRKGKPNAKRGRKYPHLQRARIGNCLVCGSEYRAVNDSKSHRQKFCKRECYELHWVDNVRPIMKEPIGLKGEENPTWKGNDAGYAAIHKWVSRWKGKPSKCENCKTTTAKKFEWCNTDHQYRRNLDDWIRMCTTCHREYDMAKLA